MLQLTVNSFSELKHPLLYKYKSFKLSNLSTFNFALLYTVRLFVFTAGKDKFNSMPIARFCTIAFFPFSKPDKTTTLKASPTDFISNVVSSLASSTTIAAIVTSLHI